MTNVPVADAIRGTRMRWSWTEGPTKGKVHEHVFHQDGTVEWRDAEAHGKPADEAERVPYSAFEVTSTVFAVSYLAKKSGFTLTVVLDFTSKRLVGFASGTKDWFPLRGTFEVLT
jgi:hypothetical protein